MIDQWEEQPTRATLKWMHTQALTILAELMTSEDDRIALRAAQTVLKMFERESTLTHEDQKEGRVVIRYGNLAARPASGTAASDREPGALPGRGVREALGQNRDR